ncbi:MAG: hypothetical protein K2Y02_03255 [Burkholderiaceae bacterium]|nr:hypothetical protein [Burkholderiaceae bacterium]
MKSHASFLAVAGLVQGVSSVVAPAHAALVINSAGENYTQSFDSLAVSGAAWANDSTLLGWSLFRQPAPGTPITSIAVGNGSGTTGSFYNFGATGSSDRSLGGVGSNGAYFGTPATASGAVAGWIAASFTNNSGQALSGFSVGFDGEQWRNGGNTTAQTMVMQYGFGSSFDTVSWTAPGGLFDWASTVNTGTGGATDGNAAGQDGRGGTISTTWNTGDSLWLRWIENNDSGSDHGLAIDNFSFTAGAAVAPSAVPLPPAFALMAAGVGLMGWAGRRRQKN